VQYLDEMIESVPSAANVGHYARMVLDVSARRDILQRLCKIMNAERDIAAAVKTGHIEKEPGKGGNYLPPRISMSDVGMGDKASHSKGLETDIEPT